MSNKEIIGPYFFEDETVNQHNYLDDLKDRIEREIKGIKKYTLNNVFNSIVKRLKFCIDVNGDSFEQYMYTTILSLNKLYRKS
jgi:hypothetical protein